MKKILFILTLLLGITVSAQKSWGVITLNDGTVKKGYARIKLINEIVKFKETKDSKKEFIDFKDIKLIKIKEGGELVNYEIKYKKVYSDYVTNDDDDDDGNGSKKDFYYSSPLLLRVVIKGKVNLYSITYNNTGYMGSNGMMMGGESSTKYYVCKNNSEFITSLVGALGGGFKKRAMAFFYDCPELVQKIKQKKFKKRHIVEVVKFYNNKCHK